MTFLGRSKVLGVSSIGGMAQVLCSHRNEPGRRTIHFPDSIKPPLCRINRHNPSMKDYWSKWKSSYQSPIRVIPAILQTEGLANCGQCPTAERLSSTSSIIQILLVEVPTILRTGMEADLIKFKRDAGKNVEIR